LELRDKLRALSRDNARSWLNNPFFIRRSKPLPSEGLPEIRVPVLVVGGERDVSDIIKIVMKLADEIPNCQSSRKPGTCCR
jgi:pimeloyl-ACP methyl ester carboxylesterase